MEPDELIVDEAVKLRVEERAREDAALGRCNIPVLYSGTTYQSRLMQSGVAFVYLQTHARRLLRIERLKKGLRIEHVFTRNG